MRWKQWLQRTLTWACARLSSAPSHADPLPSSPRSGDVTAATIGDNVQVEIGEPAEVQAFVARNKKYFENFPRLTAFILAAFTVEDLEPSLANKVVLMLGRWCADDFQELQLLAAHGHGFGALKLLRGLYERAATLQYLLAHPDATERFLDWGDVDTGKRARRLIEDFGDQLTVDEKAALAPFVDAAKELKKRFQVTDCKKCGTKRDGHTWGPDLVTMAKEGDLGQWILPCYFEPLRHAHANASGLNSRVRLEPDGTLTYPKGPTREKADEALEFAHLIMLHVGEALVKHFGQANVDAVRADAMEGYRLSWIAQDANARVPSSDSETPI